MDESLSSRRNDTDTDAERSGHAQLSRSTTSFDNLSLDVSMVTFTPPSLPELPVNGCAGDHTRSRPFPNEVSRTPSLCSLSSLVMEFSLEDDERSNLQVLQEQLKLARKELRDRNEECAKLKVVRKDIESEYIELTAKLYEESNKMIFQAMTKEHAAEKSCTEALEKVRVLQEENAELKKMIEALSLESRKHLRAISADRAPRHPTTISGLLNCGVNRSLSVLPSKQNEVIYHLLHSNDIDFFMDFKMFLQWTQVSCPMEHEFLNIIYHEDVLPCLRFSKPELSQSVCKAILDNEIVVERVKDTKNVRRCCLTECKVPCPFLISLGDPAEWLYISTPCRNRVVAVANFYQHIRYISQGLKPTQKIEDAQRRFYEIIDFRMKMAFSRFGYSVADCDTGMT